MNDKVELSTFALTTLAVMNSGAKLVFFPASNALAYHDDVGGPINRGACTLADFTSLKENGYVQTANAANVLRYYSPNLAVEVFEISQLGREILAG